MAEALTANERHAVPRDATRLAGGKYRHDVRVIESRGDSHLSRETLGGELACGFARWDFDDDTAAERAVVREKYARHSSAAELTLDRIRVAERGLEVLPEIRHTGQSQPNVPAMSMA